MRRDVLDVIGRCANYDPGQVATICREISGVQMRMRIHRGKPGVQRILEREYFKLRRQLRRAIDERNSQQS